MIISVLGCGWFGLPLASRLVKEGFSVKGSTTSPKKISKLKERGIEPYVIELTTASDLKSQTSFFDADLLIITVPPRGIATSGQDYVAAVEAVMAQFNTSAAKRVIFISSTSVIGEANARVNESSTLHPEGANGKQMTAAEDIIKSVAPGRAMVVRFAGLVGTGRDPGNFFAGKKNIPNGRAPVNLIHLDDCIGICLSIIEKGVFGYTIHACSPDHPTKKEFYTLASARAGKDVPQFNDELINWKIVDSIYIDSLLAYKFQVADWIAWLNAD